MSKKTGWTEERRAAQAARCRQNKPWDQATGPRSVSGKARASMNACKHSGEAEAALKAALAANAEFVRHVKRYLSLQFAERSDSVLENELIKRYLNQYADGGCP